MRHLFLFRSVHNSSNILFMYKQNFWQRWVQTGVTDKQLATIVSGHYCFNSVQYTNILNNIDADQYKQQLNIEINNLINFYRTFDNEIQ